MCPTWRKDLIVELREALAHLPEEMAKVLAHARTGGETRERDGQRGRRAPQMESLRSLELFSRGLGSILPGFTQLANSLRNVRLGLEAFGGFAEKTTRMARRGAAVATAAGAVTAAPTWASIGADFLKASYAGKLTKSVAQGLAADVAALRQ